MLRMRQYRSGNYALEEGETRLHIATLEFKNGNFRILFFNYDQRVHYRNEIDEMLRRKTPKSFGIE